ncbi:hypothetical protein [Alloacidobacterium sp.]|uniref:hypothetical protein n=1 Tax=Alloacidobacterium sp. TaxID=2951999 RepID=UPI002D464E09|nr:hypothetical protein [Alloacidobacterium sp.]HYK36872.1 hypothetical protein [Alloacidobacterium sp.]
MRSAEQLRDDARRLQVCCELETTLAILTRRHHGRSPEELAQWLPGEEGERLRMLLDEVREWSRETRVEAQR